MDAAIGVVRSEVVPSPRTLVRPVVIALVGSIAVYLALIASMQPLLGRAPRWEAAVTQGIGTSLVLCAASIPRRTVVEMSDAGVRVETQRLLMGQWTNEFEPWDALVALQVRTRGQRHVLRMMKSNGRGASFAVDPATLPAFEALARAHGVRIERDAGR